MLADILNSFIKEVQLPQGSINTQERQILQQTKGNGVTWKCYVRLNGHRKKSEVSAVCRGR